MSAEKPEVGKLSKDKNEKPIGYCYDMEVE